MTAPTSHRSRGVIDAVPSGRGLLRHLPLVAILAFASVLYTHALSQNGYANIFYAAGVKSMLLSWHNFFFVSFDPGGLITIDKPPLGLWLQTASAELFGFSPLSLLLPEAIAGVAAVGAVYLIVQRRFGILAAIAAASGLAVFPSFAAVVRDNNLDALLILLLVVACGTILRAIENGRLGTLLLAAVIVGLAFNTKALAAYLAVPGMALGYLICAPGSLRRRLLSLLAAGVVLAVVSLAWMVAVDVTPASQRPYVGGSTDNSELGLAFVYNGLGRVEGEFGGPGEDLQLFKQPTGPLRKRHRHRHHHPRHPKRGEPPAAIPSPDFEPAVGHTIAEDPIAFGEAPGPLRLVRKGMGDQGAWLLPLALIGLIALASIRPGRRDPRLAGLIVLGGFFAVEAIVLSIAQGIVHPYYVSALGPGCAAMAGIGMITLARRRDPLGALLLLLGVAATVVVQIYLLHQDHYLSAWIPALIALEALTLAIVVSVSIYRPKPPPRLTDRRASVASIAATVVALGALLVAPAAYALTTWQRPVNNTFPAAGPAAVGGYGGVGVSPTGMEVNEALIEYVDAHHPGTRFQLLTEASLTAATPILLGLKAAAMGGYGGIDPALDGPGLGRLVADGQARYVLIGGGYANLGGNKASRAAERVCRRIPRHLWAGSQTEAAKDLYLLDCRGLAYKLERQPS